MANTRETRTLGQLTTFTRPTSADYEDAGGATQTAGVDVPRFEYLGGEPQGIKFGDGDLLVIPHQEWFNEREGLVIARMLGEPGEVVLSAGPVELLGVDGWKTHVFRWEDDNGAVPTDPIQVFPAAPDDGVTRYCAGLLNYVLDFEVDDLVMMENFNSFVNGEGF